LSVEVVVTGVTGVVGVAGAAVNSGSLEPLPLTIDVSLSLFLSAAKAPAPRSASPAGPLAPDGLALEAALEAPEPDSALVTAPKSFCEVLCGAAFRRPGSVRVRGAPARGVVPRLGVGRAVPVRGNPERRPAPVPAGRVL
jgi:hypothetical protein